MGRVKSGEATQGKTDGKRILKISVIIPGWNEAINVSRCLTSLQRQTYDNFNVIFILGGEDPAYVEDLRNESWERLMVLDQVGPNKMKAYNSVLHLPEIGDILVFSDMDCEFPKDFLTQYAEAFIDPGKNVITGRVYPNPRSRHFVDRYHRCFEKTISPRTLKIVHAIMGANFAVRKKFLLEEFIEFDESVILGTDHAIAQRFRTIGEPIYFDPRLQVYTQMFSAGLVKYIDQQTRWIKIRVLKNRGSNPKAFRKGIKSLVFAWAMTIILPLWLFATKDVRLVAVASIWWGLAFLWAAFLTKAWWKRLKILRCQENNRPRSNILVDMVGALALVWFHYAIRIIASVQMMATRKYIMNFVLIFHD